MKRIDLGQTVSIVANIGVIAGILFLAIELRQNNDLLTSQAAFNQFAIERETIRPLIENTDGFSEFMAKVLMDESLSPAEQIQLFNLQIDIIDSWRYQFREVASGRLPADFIDVEKWRAWWYRGGIGIPERFEGDRAEHDPEFVQFIEDNVISQPYPTDFDFTFPARAEENE